MMTNNIDWRLSFNCPVQNKIVLWKIQKQEIIEQKIGNQNGLLSLSHFRINILLLKWVIPGIFSFFFLFNTVDSKKCTIKVLLMTEFEPRISGVGGDRSTN